MLNLIVCLSVIIIGLEELMMDESPAVTSAPQGITVQIIRSSSGETQLVQSIYQDEVAQTLLDIAQPGLVTMDQVLYTCQSRE